MGHTPQHKINSALDGKAWQTDVGASQGVRVALLRCWQSYTWMEILTMDADRISRKERSVPDNIIMDFFYLRR